MAGAGNRTSRSGPTDPALHGRMRTLLQQGRGRLLALHQRRAPVKNLLLATARLLDQLILQASAELAVGADLKPAPASESGLAFVALGSYGRQENCPYSDLDLMFLYESELSPEARDLIERLLALLWDLGLKVGHSTRRPDECLGLSREDLTIKTAFLDARPIGPPGPIYAEFARLREQEIIPDQVPAFLQGKLKERENRLQRFQGSIYLVEPNLMEGLGGLRDYHAALWMAKVKYRVQGLDEMVLKGQVSRPDLQAFRRSLAFLFRVRFCLHLLAGRKTDHLTFDMQEQCAAYFRLQDTRAKLGVERFMENYYRHAAAVRRFSEALMDRCLERGEWSPAAHGARPVGGGFKIAGGVLLPERPGQLGERPGPELLELFRKAAQFQVPLAEAALKEVAAAMAKIRGPFLVQPEVRRVLLGILEAPGRVYETLRRMHEAGLLGVLVPEFKKLTHRAQHDAYHAYTADVHSLFTIRELEALARGDYAETEPALGAALTELKNPSLLFLAALLHDSGKGSGGDHSQVGEKLARRAARRLGLPPAEVSLVAFLVGRHLRLNHLAQRRDIYDERLVLDFAREVGDPETLRLLYLLTFADIKAVGPEAWTSWKSSLIRELYELTSRVLERGGFFGEETRKRMARVRRQVRKLLAPRLPAGEIDRLFADLPARYFLSFSPEEIARHFALAASLKDQTAVTQIQPVPEEGSSEVIIATRDRPGLFAELAGVFTSLNLNILAAQINTLAGGVALDIFQVNDPVQQATNGERVLSDPARQERLNRTLLQVLRQEVPVAELVKQRKRPSLVKPRQVPRYPPLVEVDNAVSDRYTVIDVFAPDRVGLLYDITTALSRMALDIHLAKISTKADQAADVFYVFQAGNGKVEDAQAVERLKERIYAAIGG